MCDRTTMVNIGQTVIVQGRYGIVMGIDGRNITVEYPNTSFSRVASNVRETVDKNYVRIDHGQLLETTCVACESVYDQRDSGSNFVRCPSCVSEKKQEPKLLLQ